MPEILIASSHEPLALSVLLEEIGYQSFSATSGEKALAYLRDNTPKLRIWS
jgi:hypothetical protein